MRFIFSPFLFFVLMSDNIPPVCTGTCQQDVDSDEERLRIRKNCILKWNLLCVATNVDIPPRSPDIARPVISNADETCKSVNLPKPISL